MSYQLDHGGGYAVLSRDLADVEPLMRDHLAATLLLVLHCRARDRGGLAAGRKGAVTLAAGQCVVRLRELADLVGAGKSSVADALRRLETWGLVTVAAGQFGTQVTIMNYTKFDAVGVRQPDSDRTVAGHTRAQDATAPLLPGLALVPTEPSREERAREQRTVAEAIARDVVTLLNAELSQRCNPAGSVVVELALKLVRAGHTAADVLAVVKAKLAQWKGDPKMHKHLKPSTLMRLSSFRRYLDEDVPTMVAARATREPRSAEFFDTQPEVAEL